MSSEQRITVRVKRRFEVSAERVFDAWLDPQRVGRWLFATPTGQMVRCELDARVGGRFCLVDRRDGKDVAHMGEYREIDRPARLVFTFSDGFFEETLVTVEIESTGRGCELTLTHEGVLPDFRKDTETGWTGILESLARTISRKEAAMAFLRLVVVGRVQEAYRDLVGPGFRHHNPYFRADADSLRTALEEAAAGNPDSTLEVQRALEDDDLVAVHSHVRHKPDDPGFATVHIFRFEGDKVVELWDIGQVVPGNSPNENGMF